MIRSEIAVRWLLSLSMFICGSIFSVSAKQLGGEGGGDGVTKVRSLLHESFPFRDFGYSHSENILNIDWQ